MRMGDAWVAGPSVAASAVGAATRAPRSRASRGAGCSVARVGAEEREGGDGGVDARHDAQGPVGRRERHGRTRALATGARWTRARGWAPAEMRVFEVGDAPAERAQRGGLVGEHRQERREAHGQRTAGDGVARGGLSESRVGLAEHRREQRAAGHVRREGSRASRPTSPSSPSESVVTRPAHRAATTRKRAVAVALARAAVSVADKQPLARGVHPRVVDDELSDRALAGHEEHVANRQPRCHGRWSRARPSGP